MKRILTLFMCLAALGVAKAEDQSVDISAGSSWGYTTSAAYPVTVSYSSQYGEVYVGENSGVISLTDYVGIRVTVTEAQDSVQIKLATENSSGSSFAYVHLDDLETTVLFSTYSEELSDYETVYAGIQGAYADVSVTIESVELISGSEDNYTYTEVSLEKWWGATITGEFTTVTFTGGQWSQIGYMSSLSTDEWGGYSIELGEECTAEVNLTATYTLDGETKYITSSLTGLTELTITFDEAVNNGITTIDVVSVQYAGENSTDYIVVKSITLLEAEEEAEVGETLELDLSYLSCGWSCEVNSLVATYTAWGGASVWLGGADWTDYQYLTVEWDNTGSYDGSLLLYAEGYSTVTAGQAAAEAGNYDDAANSTSGSVAYSVGSATTDLTNKEVRAYVTQYYIQGTADGDVTFTKAYLWNESTDNAIVIVSSDDAEVVSTTYYSLTGVASKEPTKGINIVRQLLSDGTYKTTKILVK